MIDDGILSIQTSESVLLVSIECCHFDAFTIGKLQRQLFTAAIGSPTTPVIVDLSKVTLMNSAALAVLVDLVKYLHSRNRRLILANTSKPVSSSLKATHLDMLFEIAESVAAAREILGAP